MTEEQRQAVKVFASMGGNAIKAKRGMGYFKELAKKASAKRTKDKEARAVDKAKNALVSST